MNHCGLCRRHVLATWELWDGRRCCLGCIQRFLREAERDIMDRRFRDAMRRHL